MESTVRAYFERAESVHPGRLRAYVREVEKYLDEARTLIGSDEHACEVCGVSNTDADGHAVPVFMWGHGDKHWCDAHRAEFEASFVSEPNV